MMVIVQAKTGATERLGLSLRLGVLGLLLTSISLVVIAVGAGHWFSTWLAVLAAIVCVISSLAAHVVGEFPRGDDYFAARLALSIAARTGPPFLLVVIVKLIPDLPFESGFVFFVVLLYLVGLFADVTLQVMRLKQDPRQPSNPSQPC